MLVHICDECGKLSINRIAADDDNDLILRVFSASQRLDPDTQAELAHAGITPLDACQRELVQRRLWGKG
jgi:hypothetical protein